MQWNLNYTYSLNVLQKLTIVSFLSLFKRRVDGTVS